MTSLFWLEKAWGDSGANATIDEIKIALNEIREIEDELGAFWVKHRGTGAILEVHKDIEVFYTPAEFGEQLKAHLDSWKEVEHLYRHFFEENFLALEAELKNRQHRDAAENSTSLENHQVFSVTEEMPVFLQGGEKGMLSIIEKNFVYPPAARKERVGGTVLVAFTVDTTGFLTNIEIRKGIRDDINKEALRLVALLTPWKPGMQNNKPVKVSYVMPISFWPDDQFKKEFLKKNGDKQNSDRNR